MLASMFRIMFSNNRELRRVQDMSHTVQSHTVRDVDGGVDRADVILLVVTTTKVETSMSLVLESSHRAGERHRGSKD